jgi:hypothetical protein
MGFSILGTPTMLNIRLAKNIGLTKKFGKLFLTTNTG